MYSSFIPKKVILNDRSFITLHSLVLYKGLCQLAICLITVTYIEISLMLSDQGVIILTILQA
jgi:hypothetical protein